jgi:ubiquinone/menaquinone biosynthesis C-methylase UbiE
MSESGSLPPSFYELYEALPRQGPGERASTERALRLLPPLGPEQRILDLGCGSGAQTIDLARATAARIVAVDNHPPFVAQLRERIAAEGLDGRVSAEVGDMSDLRFPDGSFDVVWSEGAIFVVGFAEGLRTWRRLLAPGGHLVVSELCWLRANPAPEVREFFSSAGAEVGDMAARRAAIAEAGYELVGDFVLPDAGWWQNYYVPIAAALEPFRAAHADDPVALAVAERSEQEIEMYRRHRGAYGYGFFAMTPAS